MISVTDGKKKVRENACYQYSLIFPQCFLLSTHLLSANAFDSVKSKILSFGKGLNTS